jgi:hypothetical protein
VRESASTPYSAVSPLGQPSATGAPHEPPGASNMERNKQPMEVVSVAMYSALSFRKVAPTTLKPLTMYVSVEPGWLGEVPTPPGPCAAATPVALVKYTLLEYMNTQWKYAVPDVTAIAVAVEHGPRVR